MKQNSTHINGRELPHTKQLQTGRKLVIHNAELNTLKQESDDIKNTFNQKFKI